MARVRLTILDGLRGVAALMVIVYHLFECFPVDTWIIGHGYLAVDFFFMLSGFVIGYAYDSRWDGEEKMTFGRFMKRRLIRLHPMVVFGVLLGLVAFIAGGCRNWNGGTAGIMDIVLCVLMSLCLLPQWNGAPGEIRGNGEMFPLNGPHWSLFFEYIGNIIYALILRRLSLKALKTIVIVLGCGFLAFALSDMAGYGNIGVGWTLDGANFGGGMLRMLFPFSTGLYISRVFKPMRVRGAFRKCSLALVVLLSVPVLNGPAWINCLYEFSCVAFAFPLIVWAGASDTREQSRTCSFLGEISYPLYAVHYPSMYLFYSYIGFPDTFRTPGSCWWIMIMLFAGNVLLAWLALRFYDKPLRLKLNNCHTHGKS